MTNLEMKLYPKLRKPLAVLLFVEAVRAAFWLAALLPTLPWRDAWTLLLIGLRAIVSALQIVSGIRLFENRQPGATLAQSALLISAALMTCEIGWRLAPSNVDPTFRWWIVGGYWVYAIAAVAFMSGHRDIDKAMSDDPMTR